MKIKRFQDSATLAQAVARELATRLSSTGSIGFATGRTMDPIYEALLELAPRVSAQVWMLDEYLGLSAEDQRSYRYYLQTRVFKPLQVPPAQIHLPQLEVLAPEAAALAYEVELQRFGGLRLQLLGLGLNGHLGLNEPGSTLSERTRIVKIAEKTRVSNQSFFGSLSEVPTHALTLGLATLNDAQELWLIVSGAAKAEILQEVLEGPVTSRVPASLLRDHPGLIVFVDEAAASRLR